MDIFLNSYLLDIVRRNPVLVTNGSYSYWGRFCTSQPTPRNHYCLKKQALEYSTNLLIHCAFSFSRRWTGEHPRQERLITHVQSR